MKIGWGILVTAPLAFKAELPAAIYSISYTHADVTPMLPSLTVVSTSHLVRLFRVSPYVTCIFRENSLAPLEDKPKRAFDEWVK